VDFRTEDVMTKPHAAGLLGGLTLVAVLLLTGLGRAQLAIFPPDFHAVLKQACNDSANHPSACIALVELLKEVGKPGDTEANSLKGLDKGFSLTGSESCDSCVEKIQDAEIALAAAVTNPGEQMNVPGTIPNVILQACIDNFPDATEQQCRAAVDDVAAVVDQILGTLPPLTACRELNYCPIGN
jgi:hypothetical protein